MVTFSRSVHMIFSGDWNLLVDTLMRSGVIEIGDILANETIQMSLSQDQHMIQTFSPDTANEALTNCIGFRGTHRCSDDIDSSCMRDLCKTLSIPAVVVSN
jgi:hypothetical protein